MIITIVTNTLYTVCLNLFVIGTQSLTNAYDSFYVKRGLISLSCNQRVI